MSLMLWVKKVSLSPVRAASPCLSVKTMLADVEGFPAPVYAFNGHGTSRCAGVALPAARTRGDVLRDCGTTTGREGGIGGSV